MKTHFKIQSHAIATMETLTNVIDIRVDRSLTAGYFVPRDYTPPNTLVALSFPPPRISDGRVSEPDLYDWLLDVVRALEAEEAQAARVPSIAVLYEEEDCQEYLAALQCRDEALAEEPIHVDLPFPSHPGEQEEAVGTGPIVQWDDSGDDGECPLPSRWDWDAFGTSSD